MDINDELLIRGVDKIYPSREALKDVLLSGKKLRIYQGFDPTGPELHIGHAVALRKLHAFQILGHHVIFLIGDYTARIGDPSGKSSSRKLLSKEEILKNAGNYKKQASKILDFEGDNPCEIRFNSEWHDKMSSLDFLELARNITYSQLRERDSFEKRMKSGEDVYLNELLYPIMQAYDSIALNVDLEIGGTDQTFNMLMGRKLMRNVTKKEKFVMTVPLLTDSTGQKIGKTEGNVISLSDNADIFYGKIMALSDDSIISSFILLTDFPITEINKREAEIKEGMNPLGYKKQLAFELTKQFNSEEEAKDAQVHFEKTFQERAPEYDIKVSAGDTLASTITPFTSLDSVSDAKRMIKQGAVDVNDATVTDPSFKIKIGDKIKVGQRTFLKAK